MSTVKISLRLRGNLPPTEELTRAIGIVPTEVRRRGQSVTKNRVQPVDVLILDLVKYDTESLKEDLEKQMLQAATTLQHIAPALNALDRNNCDTDLYISTIREEDQGGFSLPLELVTAAATAKLTIQISILVMLDDYEEPEAQSELSTTAC